MSWSGKLPNWGNWLGLGESNTLSKMGFGNVSENIITGGLPLGYQHLTEDAYPTVANMFKKPDMPEVAPLPNAAVDNSEALKTAARLEAERLRKRKGMKATILTDDSSTLMAPNQSQKAELLG